ncbi:membrane protein insertion efficiency factor YidD [Planctomicrobium sp. SH661]|uniref:membrane protein insertion efficiency factor YidD n=1 Tax=Planctomicrobium sp. SH661 TaxID=3448124 RepID=UPI003F5AEFF3
MWVTLMCEHSGQVDSATHPVDWKSRGWVSTAVSWLLILAVKFYQITLGPFLGGRCRFHPSCSYYFIEAVKKHGPIRGTLKGVWRVCRCQPFCPGGYDPP